MDKDVELFIEKFKIIANKGWIKSTVNSKGSVGLTFEKELCKKPDNKFLPDYKDIEIKCSCSINKYAITFFSISFDGPSFPEINRIVEKYGYYDYKSANKKVLFANISNKNTKIINKKYIFKLDIDYSEEKIFLCVYDIHNNLIERKSYIYLNKLYNHIKFKLKKIAIVYSRKKIENDLIYKFACKEKFLCAIENGIINSHLSVSIYRSGYKAGKQKNKNLTFLIDKDKMNLVFDEIYSIEI